MLSLCSETSADVFLSCLIRQALVFSLCVHDPILSFKAFQSFVMPSLLLLHRRRCWVCVWHPGLYASWGRSSSPLRLTFHKGRLHCYSVKPSTVGRTGRYSRSSSVVLARSIRSCEWYKNRGASFLTCIWMTPTVLLTYPRSIGTQHNPRIISVMTIEVKTVSILSTKGATGSA